MAFLLYYIPEVNVLPVTSGVSLIPPIFKSPSSCPEQTLDQNCDFHSVWHLINCGISGKFIMGEYEREEGKSRNHTRNGVCLE